MTTTADATITAQPGVAAGHSRAETGSSRQSPPFEEPTVERPIASAVIHLLGACALLGLAGVIGLIALGADASNLAALTALVGPAIGGLASILATTRTSPPAAGRRNASGS
jgi:hypothetical protein